MLIIIMIIMIIESDVYTSYDWCTWYSHRRIIKGTSVMVIVVGNGHGDTSSNPGRN